MFDDRVSRKEMGWLLAIAVLLVSVALKGQLTWLGSFPAGWVFPLSDVLNAAMSWFVGVAGGFFRAIADVLALPINGVRALLEWLPWIVTLGLCALVTYLGGGWKLAVFAVLTLLYMLIVGYWDRSMNTLALVSVTVPLSIAVGFGFGVFGFLSARAERAIMPSLDLLQTIPAFAYLIPVLLLFGFGTVPGLIASLLYAFPPMVRNTILGLRSVSPEIIESGMMSGATNWQLFWQVRVPSALRQLLLGVNQTTMAALSMVIVASIIGGSDDIGWEVLRKMQKAQFGESLVAGLVIALIAMVMDRTTWGFAMRGSAQHEERSLLYRYRYLIVAVLGSLLFFILSSFAPALTDYPSDWVLSPAGYLNDGIEYVVANYRPLIESFKNLSFFYLMLPVRIGFEQAISPFSWGFALTDLHKIVYALAVLGGGAYAYYRHRKGLAAAIVIIGTILFFGLTGTPWPALVLVITMLSYSVGGKRLALWSFAGLLFLLFSGVWDRAVLSLYLCGIAVLLSFTLGSLLGIWASTNDYVSAVLRPINDTLQTMPLFVLLIPFVMIFRIGEFTALLAIIAYAFVPAARYTEHGLRNLPTEVIEAAQAMGCTRRQLLWQVKLPLALPTIAVGLNQTILYGITMLVIAALVGTNGLGQMVYIGLGDGDFGVGMTAGIGMAIIAMLADRITQAWRRGLTQDGTSA